jgi:serine/threonine protein kinase
MSYERIQKYCIQLCEAIASLHENGLFLGDFNPTNVSIDKYDNCFLTDIG